MFDWLSGVWSAFHFSGGGVLLGVLIFVVSSVGGLALAGLIVVRMPVAYFCEHARPTTGRRPGLHGWAWHVAKNLLGALIVFLGVVLSLPGVPGPGLLVMLVGLMLADFPGKLRVERWLVRRPGVLETINKLRSRYGRPPMELD